MSRESVNDDLCSHAQIERDKLATILEGMGDGLIVVDQHQRVLLVNAAARAALGLTSKTLHGRPVQEVIQHSALLEMFAGGRASLPAQVEFPVEDGRVFNALLTPIPEVGLALTMQDITSFHELDRAKNDFVNTVSHDLRSPLTAILGYVELVGRAGPLTSQQREFIKRVQLSVQNITELIDDLLDLGRIEADLDLARQAVSLVAVVGEAARSCGDQLTQKRQHLTSNLPDDLPQVYGNPGRLQQMVRNILDNAIKYSPTESEIRVYGRAEAGQVILQVSDDGRGILPAEQPHIFDKFYRGRNIPADVSGSGLGLAIVKSIVENHGGRVWVESQLGVGSTFTVVLPAMEQG